MRQVQVDFGQKLRDWDGFGVNYVETSQTQNYGEYPQDYGGFSILTDANRQLVLDMVFGGDGLKPGAIKMFLDPFHQDEPGPGYHFDPNIMEPSAYDHARTTKWMLFFARQGLKRTAARSGRLQVITTLYGPPAWMTQQKFVRGRDLNPELKHECAKYMIAWARHLRDVEGLPVRYISLHNEGESYDRWPEDGSTPNWERGHDYNLYWPPEQVVDFLRFMRKMLDRHGLKDVGLTPGETTNLYRFAEWGYAWAIANDALAAKNLGLITSHSFIHLQDDRFYGDYRSTGSDLLRQRKPRLHTWITSCSWRRGDVFFINTIRHTIYAAKVNAIIPWACIQRPAQWFRGDPNPGAAFHVSEEGQLSILPGYYYYKQVCRAGQPGMAVCRVLASDSEVGLIGFAGNGTANPDAFVLLNLSDEAKSVNVQVSGSDKETFEAYRTSENEQYVSLGGFTVQSDMIAYKAPSRSVTTFYAA